MKIAIPVWEDKVSPVLDTASRLLIVEVLDQKEASRFEKPLDAQDLSLRSLRIKDLGIDVLICGAISRQFLNMLTASGMDIIPWISGHPEDVLKAYLQGNLLDPRFFMPGCRRKKSGQKVRNQKAGRLEMKAKKGRLKGDDK